MDENSISNFSRIMRYAFRVNDSLRVSGQPATTFSPLPNYSLNYSPNYPPNYSPNYPPNYLPINPDSNQANPSINPSTNYQDGKNDNDDYFPFEGSIMSPIFPGELMTGTGNENSSQSSSLIKTEEIIILTIIFSLWIGIIILFFKQWGKIRLLEPYHPSYEAAEDCEPGAFVSAPGTTSPLARLNSTKVMRTGGQLTTPNYSNLITKNKWKKVNTLVHVMAPNTSISVASVPSISTTTNPIGNNTNPIEKNTNPIEKNTNPIEINTIPTGKNEARISSPTSGQKIVTRKDSSVINIELDQINPVESFVKGLVNGKKKDEQDSREGKSSGSEQKKNSIEEDHSKEGKQDEKNREERRKAWKELKGKKEETHVNMLGSTEDEEERRGRRGRKDEGFITSSVSCTNLLPDPSYCFQRKRNCSSCIERVRSRTSIDTNMNVSSGINRIECNLRKDMSETNPKKINPVDINPEKINPAEINDSKKRESDPEGMNQCQEMELKPLRVFHIQYSVNESGKKKDSEEKGEKKNGQDHHKNNDQGLNCSATRNKEEEEKDGTREKEKVETREKEKEDNSHPLNLV